MIAGGMGEEGRRRKEQSGQRKGVKGNAAHDQSYITSNVGRRRDGGSLSQAGSCPRTFGALLGF